MNQPAPSPRTAAREARTATILAAALDVFADRGFEAARMEDVAQAAGVAKGTLYLYFDGKEALLEALIGQATDPALGRVEQTLAEPEDSAEALLRRAIATVRREILENDRRRVIRLVLTEGHRFPRIAAYYHRHVVARATAMLGAVIARGAETGEFAPDAPARFPHLVIAPFLFAILWDELFGACDPLDTRGLLDAHVELLLRGLKARP